MDIPSYSSISRALWAGRRVRRYGAWLAIAWLAAFGNAGGRVSAASMPTVSILLTWDANTEDDLAGYRVRYGVASGHYGAPLDVGNVTEVVLPGMVAGTTYFFVVSAYGFSGDEGPLSDEIHFTPRMTPPSFVMEPLSAPSLSDPALTAPKPTISGWTLAENNGFRFIVTATPGQTLHIFASSDMLNWEFLGAFDNPSGRFQAIDYIGETGQTRYYQVRPAGG